MPQATRWASEKSDDLAVQAAEVGLPAETDPFAEVRGDLLRGRDQIADQRKTEQRFSAVKDDQQVRVARTGRGMGLAPEGLFDRLERDGERHVGGGILGLGRVAVGATEVAGSGQLQNQGAKGSPGGGGPLPRPAAARP